METNKDKLVMKQDELIVRQEEFIREQDKIIRGLMNLNKKMLREFKITFWILIVLLAIWFIQGLFWGIILTN